MNNREIRTPNKTVHLFLGLQRTAKGHKKHNCIRHVIKHDTLQELSMFENKLLSIGGQWRIHKTVNARNVEKARIHLLKNLIEYPEKAAYVDTEWRTSLLQRECKATKYFMLDIDTQEEKLISILDSILDVCEIQYLNNPKKTGMIDETDKLIIKKIKSPKGYHYITHGFDTREVEKLEYVSLLRDGYYYIKTVGEIK